MSLLPARKPGPARVDLSGPTGSGYGPADLQSAYALAAASLNKGKGQTVAIVDAYDDPTAAADLAVYRKQWGLPACAAGCLTILNQGGQTSPLPGVDPTGGWELEESTDLDMVSAICPNCRIELVEANSTSLSDLGTAEDTAAGSGAKFISDSWDGPDGYGSSADDQYFDHPGVVITVAAGDDGFGASYPAASQFVTSVGGTTLERAPGTTRGWTESAWTGTGSGCSLNEPKPAWQTADDSLAGGCLNRTDNDVAAVADENTPVWLYDSYPFQGAAPQWGEVGGTSVASPIIASVYALASAPLRGSYPASYPYSHPGDLFPVTSGTNGPCEPTRPYLCTAGPGYNGPDGWGTPDGTAAFTAPAHTVTAFNPGFQDDGAGTSVRLRVKALASGGGRLVYSARGLPRDLSIDRSAGLITGRLPVAAATDPVTVTVADASGDRATVGFSFVIVPDLTAAYHPVTGPVTLGLPGLCLNDAERRRQHRNRNQHRQRSRHRDPGRHLQRQHRPAVDLPPGPRPRRRRRAHHRRHVPRPRPGRPRASVGPAVAAVHRSRQPGLDPAGLRPEPGQPRVGRLPRRPRLEHGQRHGGRRRRLRFRRRPGLHAAARAGDVGHSRPVPRRAGQQPVRRRGGRRRRLRRQRRAALGRLLDGHPEAGHARRALPGRLRPGRPALPAVGRVAGGDGDLPGSVPDDRGRMVDPARRPDHEQHRQPVPR